MANEIIKDEMDVGNKESLDRAAAELKALGSSIEGIICDNGVDVSGEGLSPADFARLFDVLECRIPRMNVARSVRLPLLSREKNGDYVIKIEVFNFGDKNNEKARRYFLEIQDIVAAFNIRPELRKDLSYAYELLKLLYVYLEGEFQPVYEKQVKLKHDKEKAMAALAVIKFISTRAHYEFCREEQFEKDIVRAFEKFKKSAYENGVTQELTIEDVKEAFYSEKMLGYPFLNDARSEFCQKVKARHREDAENLASGIKGFFAFVNHYHELNDWSGNRETVRNTLTGMGEDMRTLRENAARKVEIVLGRGAEAVVAKKKAKKDSFIDLGDVPTCPPAAPESLEEASLVPPAAPESLEGSEPALEEQPGSFYTKKSNSELHDIFDVEAYEEERSVFNVVLEDEDIVEISDEVENPDKSEEAGKSGGFAEGNQPAESDGLTEGDQLAESDKLDEPEEVDLDDIMEVCPKDVGKETAKGLGQEAEKGSPCEPEKEPPQEAPQELTQKTVKPPQEAARELAQKAAEPAQDSERELAQKLPVQEAARELAQKTVKPPQEAPQRRPQEVSQKAAEPAQDSERELAQKLPVQEAARELAQKTMRSPQKAVKPAVEDDDGPQIVVNREIEVPDEVFPVDIPRLSMDVVVRTRQATVTEERDALQASREDILQGARIEELKSAVSRMTDFGFQMTEKQAHFIYRICFMKDEESLALKRQLVVEKYSALKYPDFDHKKCDLHYVSIKLALLMRMAKAFLNDSETGPEEDAKLKGEIFRILLRDHMPEE